MSDPHGHDPDEDPERHLGERVPDPWDEDEQPARPASLADYNTSGWT